VSERISLLLLLRQYKRSVSKASQKTFGLSTGILFALKMIAKHLLSSEKMLVEPTTETIL
jgi:hypothetical protein